MACLKIAHRKDDKVWLPPVASACVSSVNAIVTQSGARTITGSAIASACVSSVNAIVTQQHIKIAHRKDDKVWLPPVIYKERTHASQIAPATQSGGHTITGSAIASACVSTASPQKQAAFAKLAWATTMLTANSLTKQMKHVSSFRTKR